MSQALEVNLIQTALWQQGDIRDPLGVWGARALATGNVTLGEIKVGITVPAALRAAYIYTCYALNASVLASVGSTQMSAASRLLTNWPDVDPTAGVQGFATSRFASLFIDASFTAPRGSTNPPLVTPNDRFLLLFDPRPGTDDLTIAEIKISPVVEDDTYAFEAYGYFWDRSVLNAPGGPRHPGSS